MEPGLSGIGQVALAMQDLERAKRSTGRREVARR
jgi:hypothetical protein